MIQQTSISAVLGVVIANQRVIKHVDQAAVAAQMGLSQASYSRLESGKAVFSVEHLFRLSEILQTTPQALLDEVDRYRASLNAQKIAVEPTVRANSTQAKTTTTKDSDGSGVGTFVAGAALGALIMTALTRK
jgi:transcriptional regulator with XRE-family HTH domain